MAKNFNSSRKRDINEKQSESAEPMKKKPPIYKWKSTKAKRNEKKKKKIVGRISGLRNTQ